MIKAIRNILMMMAVMALSSPGRAGDTTSIRTDLYCLAQNIYFEARSEPLEGKLAVAHVVLNRMADDRFPEKLCSVIRQGGEKRRHRCQFSWFCDGRSDRPQNQQAWQESLVLATLIRAGLIPDPTGAALWYHADYVAPGWAGRLGRVTQIGRHIFYTDPAATEQVQIAAAEGGS
ncbi:MAG: cell wall hydrolase [Rhodospirillaceae bacterium]